MPKQEKPIVQEQVDRAFMRQVIAETATAVAKEIAKESSIKVKLDAVELAKLGLDRLGLTHDWKRDALIFGSGMMTGSMIAIITWLI